MRKRLRSRIGRRTFEPELEHQQGPDALGVIVACGGVLVEQSADLLPAAPPKRRRAGIEQHLARELTQLAAKPSRHGEFEALLGRVEDLVRHPATQGHPKHALALAAS